MLVVDLKRLGKQADLPVRYLTVHLDEPGRVKGSKIQLTSTNLRTVNCFASSCVTMD
jgi:hypothetical protein